MLINLKALGITEEALTNSILNELDMTKEEAVDAIAKKLGVERKPAEAATISNGDKVVTTEGECRAVVVSPEEAAAFQKSAEVLARIYG